MTAHRAVNLALTAAFAVGIAAILLAGPVLDDHSADWPESTALRDAQQHAQAIDHRRVRISTNAGIWIHNRFAINIFCQCNWRKILKIHLVHNPFFQPCNH